MKVHRNRSQKILLVTILVTIFLFTFVTLWSRENEQSQINNTINGGGTSSVLKTAGFPFNFINNINNDPNYSIVWQILIVDLGFWALVSWFIARKIVHTQNEDSRH